MCWKCELNWNGCDRRVSSLLLASTATVRNSWWSRACHVVCGRHNWNSPWMSTEMMCPVQLGSWAVGAAATVDRKRVGKNLDAIIHIKRNTHELKRNGTERAGDAKKKLKKKTLNKLKVCAQRQQLRPDPPIHRDPLILRSFGSVSTPLILHWQFFLGTWAWACAWAGNSEHRPQCEIHLSCL